MKKVGYFVVLFITLFTWTNVNAACSYEKQVELQSEANNVRAVYEAGLYSTGEEEWTEEGEYAEVLDYKIISYVYNLTEDIYIVVENLNTGDEITYTYEDSDNGTISWETNDVSEIVEYKITVYSDYVDCADEALANLSLKTPKFNEYSMNGYCDGLSVYYCQEFTLVDITMSEQEVYEAASALQKQTQEEEEEEEQASFWELYGIYFIIGVVVVLVGVAIYVIVRTIQRRSIK